MKRREDWPVRLEEAISAARGMEFKTGAHDCALFVADCVLAMTDHDFAAPFRGVYGDPEGAVRALAANGAEDIEAYLEGLLGLPVAPKAARRGDVVSFGTPEGVAIGVIDNTGLRFAAAGTRGLVFLPLRTARRSWRV